MNDALEFTARVTREFDSPLLLFAAVFAVGVIVLLLLTSLSSSPEDSSDDKFNAAVGVVVIPIFVATIVVGINYPRLESLESTQTMISQENKTPMMHQSLKTNDLKNAVQDKGYRLDKIDGKLLQTSYSKIPDPTIVLTPEGKSQLTVMDSDSSFAAQCVVEPKGPVENNELRFHLRCKQVPSKNSGSHNDGETFLLGQ